MPDATLHIEQPGAPPRDEKILGDASSLGRHARNDIALAYDHNVAPYHARIGVLDGEFWLSNLVGPGTIAVNGQEVELETRLHDGDMICLGGTTFIKFHTTGGVTSGGDAAKGAAGDTSARPRPGGPQWPYFVVVGVIVLAAVGGAGFLFNRLAGGQCRGTARIISPGSGSTVSQPVNIVLDYQEARCIERVSYQLNGVEFASSESPPYMARLDPAAFTNLSGGTQVLTVTVENRGGEKQRQPDEVLLALGAGKAPAATPAVPTPEAPTPEPTAGESSTLTIADVQKLCEKLAGQITRKNDYVFDPELAAQIRERTNDYRRGGYTKRAHDIHWDLEASFSAHGLPLLLGYVLAMSRSRFDERVVPGATPIWQMPLPVARVYLSPGEDVSALSAPKRSTEVAAAHTKALYNFFEDGDFMYAVACFGTTLDEAGRLRSELDKRVPDRAERRDFLKVVKLGVVTPEAKARVVSFFAAGIVGDNPRLFGLTNERAFSNF
jgi:hypothetical protein